MKKYRVFFVVLLILFMITPSFGGYVTEKNGKQGYKGEYIKRSYTNQLPLFIPIWNFAYINPLPGAQKELPVINIKGTYTIPNEFDKVEIIDSEDNAIVVSKDGKKGIVIGNTQYEDIELIYDDIILLNRYTQYMHTQYVPYAIVKKDGKVGVVAFSFPLNGSSLKLSQYIPIEYDNITPDYNNLYFITELNGKKGFVGHGLTIPAEYDDIILMPDYIVAIKDSKRDIFKIPSPYSY